MFSPEIEPFMEAQAGSPPVSPVVERREDYFPSAEPPAPAPWQRRSSVSTTDQPRPVFDSLARSPGKESTLMEGQISSPPPHSYPLPPSPTQPTTKPLGGGAARRLSRASAKSIDRQSFLVPTSPPAPSQQISTSPIRTAPSTLPPQETSSNLPVGSRLQLAPRTPPHAALASPPLSSTLSSSRRTSGSSVDRITPPSSSSSLASIPGLGPAQFSGGLTPDLSNPYRSQMERPLDTVKRLSRQVERRDYTRGAPSAGGPSSYRTEDMFASSEMSNKNSHSPTPSTHSAPAFVMSGAYPSAMNGAYPGLSMNGAYPSALAMSGPYPTRGSQISSFENPWPTWEGPSSSTIDAKLASKKARRMSSAPNNQDGDRRKQSQSEHGSSATRKKSHGKERELLSPNGSPILAGNGYSPSPLSQASSPTPSPAGSPGLPPASASTVTLDRSGSKKKKRLSMWGRSKTEDEPPMPTTPTNKDLLDGEDARSRTVSAPAKSTSSPIPPVPAVPATLSSPRSASNSSRLRTASPSRAPPSLAPIITSELAPPPTVSSSPSSSTTATATPQSSQHHSGGGLLSHFGSHKGGRRGSTPKSAPPSPKKLAPPGPPPVVAPALSTKSRKVSRDMALRDEAKEEKGLGGLWKRLSMSKKGKGERSPHASPTEGGAVAAGGAQNDASRAVKQPNGSSLGHRGGQEASKPPHVADVVVKPNGNRVASPSRAPPPPPPPTATPERSHPHSIPTPSSSESSSSTATARASRPSRPQDPRVSPSPPSLDPAVVGSHQPHVNRNRSPTRLPPTEPLPPTPPSFYGSTEVGATPSPPKPLRHLPSPPRNSESQSNPSLPSTNHHSSDPISHSSTFPNIRHLPHLPSANANSKPALANIVAAAPPNFSRRGASYDPPSPSLANGGQNYSDILARSVSHPSRPPTPPPKEFIGHELAQTSSSSEGSRGMPLWEPRTAGSSFTVYTASEDSEGVKV